MAGRLVGRVVSIGPSGMAKVVISGQPGYFADADRQWLGALVHAYTGLITTVTEKTGPELHVAVVTANAKAHQATFCDLVLRRDAPDVCRVLESRGFPRYALTPPVTAAEALALGAAAFADVPDDPPCPDCGEPMNRHIGRRSTILSSSGIAVSNQCVLW